MTRRHILLALIVAGGAFTYGYASHKYEVFPHGAWSRVKAMFAGDPEPRRWFVPAGGADQPELDESLGALGYSAGVQRASGSSGVVAHDPARTSPGYNLFVSGHGPQALLTDMEGTVLHSWSKEPGETWPDMDASLPHEVFWRRARVAEDGDLVALTEYVGIARFDSESNVLWSHAGLYHHDIHLQPDGRVFTLRRELVNRPDIRGGRPSYDDAVVVFDVDGNEIDKYSILTALDDSDYAPVVRQVHGDSDIFHTNSVFVLDDRLAGAGPAFAPGNLLVCLRDLHLIAVIGAESRRVEWLESGMWFGQHDPRPTDDGTIVLFDNQGLGEQSRVLEFDVPTRSIVWQFGGTSASAFYSEFCGAVQVLPNDNVLVTDSMAGRAIEVTRDGLVVWEYRNPFRAGDDKELVAVMFENERLPAEFPISWASRPGER